uniref:Actin n=1 Tax=Globodera pallida TaxID=36090 RepID=A0A183BL88_GLOPA
MSGSFDAVIANQPVVIDNGSGVVKAGFAGEQAPKCVFGNFVGRPKHVRVMAGALEGDVFIEYRGLLSLKYPMEHGIVTDWNDMEKAEPSEHPVLLTEAPLNPQGNREKAAEIFFETFNVPALFVQIQAVLSLYSSGRTTGVVLDSGDGVTHVVPIFEGFAIEHGIQRIDIAGRDVTRHLKLLLRKEGHLFTKSSEFEIVREIKEQRCRLQTTPLKEEPTAGDPGKKLLVGAVALYLQQLGNDPLNKSILHTLPDGSKIEIGPSHYRAPELLFRPELIGEECEGIAHCVANAIFKCDVDLRKTLYQNIVLSGVIQFLIVPALFDFFRLSDEQIPPQGNNLESERELREVLAHSLVNIAEIAGTSFTDRELFPIFQRYMRDTPEVQYALLQHLSGFCKILSAEYRENMIRELSHQVTIDPGDSRTWRQRVQFAGFELTRLVQFFPITHINRHLSGFALSFSADRISEVRICGVDMLAVVLAAFIRNEWDDAADVEPPKLVDTSTNNSMDTFCGEDGEKTPPNTLTNSESAVSNEPLELPLTDRLLADIRFGFWRTRHFGRLLYSLAQNKLIADEQFHYLFHNDLMKISEDDVANVRQYFCLLARHKHFDQFNGQSIRKRLERMATDDVDLENRNLAKIYAGQLAILPKNHRLVPVVEEMRREEKRHLDEMERLVGKYGVRPTALAPICSVAGFLLGAGTALMGEKAAMACEAPFYGALKTVIQTGCKTAIWITQRI